MGIVSDGHGLCLERLECLLFAGLPRRLCYFWLLYSVFLSSSRWLLGSSLSFGVCYLHSDLSPV